MARSRRACAGWSAAAAVLLVGGCAVGPDFKTPAPPRVERYSPAAAPSRLQADGVAQTIELGRAPAADWWRLFRSSGLDALVAEGLKNSPTLASARAALLESQDQARAGAGVFYPSAGGTFAAGRERITPVDLGQKGQGATFNLYTLSGSVAYAVDLFGGERRSVEALRAAADRQKYAVGSAYLLLTGNIVDTAIARAGYAAQGDALEDIVRLEEAQHDVLSAEAKAGHAAVSAVLQIDEQLAVDRENLAAVRQREDAATDLLSILIARDPGEARPAAPALNDFAVPADAPVSLPSQIVRQRPDILQAEAALHQANANVGVATAALFPSITLTGDYGGESTLIGQLGASAGRFWSIGPRLDVPLFEGGARWYGRKAAQAAYVQAQADYRQTVLVALEQVADALKAIEADAGTSAAARSGFDAAELDSGLSRVNGQAGTAADFDIMTADIQADRMRLDLISAEAQRLQDVVALYLASGGGWSGQASEIAHVANAGADR